MHPIPNEESPFILYCVHSISSAKFSRDTVHGVNEDDPEHHPGVDALVALVAVAEVSLAVAGRHGLPVRLESVDATDLLLAPRARVAVAGYPV